MTVSPNNQQLTIEEGLEDILNGEVQIVRYMVNFFCKTLKEISTDDISIDKKVELAIQLIGAAARKEGALADVLEAINKFIPAPIEWIALAPGASYLVTSSCPTVQAITFTARTDTGCTGQKIAGFYHGVVISETSNISSIPNRLTIDLGLPLETSFVTICNTGNCVIYIRNIVAQ